MKHDVNGLPYCDRLMTGSKYRAKKKENIQVAGQSAGGARGWVSRIGRLATGYPSSSRIFPFFIQYHIRTCTAFPVITFCEKRRIERCVFSSILRSRYLMMLTLLPATVRVSYMRVLIIRYVQDVES